MGEEKEVKAVTALDEQELAFYENVFRGMLCADSQEYIENDSVEHAAILVKCLIESARESVKIFCKALSSDVWGRPEIVHAVEDALANKVTFQVSVMEALQKNGTSQLLLEDSSSEIRMFPYQDVCANFLLVDDKAFRFEPNCEERKGFAVAKADENANVLKNTFARVWDLSKPIQRNLPNAQ